MVSLCIGMVLVFCTSTVNSAIFFPSNSAYGIFAALAVPLDLGPHRNVFISYNFEANYNLPVNWQLPTYLEFGDTRLLKDKSTKESQIESFKDKKRLKDQIQQHDLVENFDVDNVTDCNVIEENFLGGPIDNNATERVPENESIPSASKIEEESERDSKRERRSLLSRQTFYSMLKQRFQTHGYDGQNCLLRLICETNASSIGENNGFLGSVLHVMFAPSSSKDEGLPTIYYKAEFDGQQKQCKRYRKKCPQNILDFISTPVFDLISRLRTK